MLSCRVVNATATSLSDSNINTSHQMWETFTLVKIDNNILFLYSSFECLISSDTAGYENAAPGDWNPLRSAAGPKSEADPQHQQNNKARIITTEDYFAPEELAGAAPIS